MIAKSLTNIMDDSLVVSILDRSQNISAIVDQVINNWTIDMFSRNPTTRMLQDDETGILYHGTDLDLFTVLYSIAARKAVINIPEYRNLRPETSSSDEVVISKENRHGQIHRVESKIDSHSFSMMIKDVMVIKTDNDKVKIGAPRNFNVVNDYGERHEGLSLVDWVTNTRDDAFFAAHNMDIYQGTFAFEYFVHPTRYRSFMGSPYIISKILVDRITDQAKHYRAEAKELEDRDVKFIGRGGPQDLETDPDKIVGESKSIIVPNLEAKIWGPEIHGTYPIRGLEYRNRRPVISNFEQMPTIQRENQRQLRSIRRYGEKISNTLSYKLGPWVRAPARAAELAYHMHGMNNDGNPKNPGWGIPTREDTMMEDGKILWNRLSIDYNLHLLYRVTNFSIKVAK